MIFKTRDGEVKEGTLVRQYGAFEGGMRFIISVNGKDYRCVKDADGNMVELVVWYENIGANHIKYIRETWLYLK